VNDASDAFTCEDAPGDGCTRLGVLRSQLDRLRVSDRKPHGWERRDPHLRDSRAHSIDRRLSNCPHTRVVRVDVAVGSISIPSFAARDGGRLTTLRQLKVCPSNAGTISEMRLRLPATERQNVVRLELPSRSAAAPGIVECER